jgi:hypothetical protein
VKKAKKATSAVALLEREGDQDEWKYFAGGEDDRKDAVRQLAESAERAAWIDKCDQAIEPLGGEGDEGENARPAEEPFVVVEIEKVEKQKPERDVLQGEEGLLHREGGKVMKRYVEATEDLQRKGRVGEERHPQEQHSFAVAEPGEQTQRADQGVQDGKAPGVETRLHMHIIPLGVVGRDCACAADKRGS